MADVTDPNGEFHLSGLHPGATRITARHPDGSTFEQPIDLRPDLEPMELRFPRGVPLRGQVLTTDAQAVPRASVTLRGLTGASFPTQQRTDSQGRFSFAGITPGVYLLRAISSTGQSNVVEIQVESTTPQELALILEGESSVERAVTGVEAAPADLHGLVTVDAQPLVGAQIQWREESGSIRDGGQTDLQGKFHIAGLRNGPFWLGIQDSRTGVRVSYRFGSVATTDLEIGIASTPLDGVVLDPQANPVPRVRLSVELLGNPDRFVEAVAVSDSGGWFRFPWLPEGTYRVRAEATGSAPTFLTLSLARGVENTVTVQLH
jgi:hypothetical protein